MTSPLNGVARREHELLWTVAGSEVLFLDEEDHPPERGHHAH